VRVRAPEGARITLAEEGGDSGASANEALVGLQVGVVYRLRVSDIPNANGLDLYPTIELIDRTYPPAGLALRYPVPIDLTQEELELATTGAFVTRVIYIEEPSTALAVARKAGDEVPWIEAPKGEDPLVTADREGRPIAILRIGGRVPQDAAGSGAGVGPVPEFRMLDPAAACVTLEQPGQPTRMENQQQ
jgi:hypothetical protein